MAGVKADANGKTEVGGVSEREAQLITALKMIKKTSDEFEPLDALARIAAIIELTSQLLELKDVPVKKQRKPRQPKAPVNAIPNRPAAN